MNEKYVFCSFAIFFKMYFYLVLREIGEVWGT